MLRAEWPSGLAEAIVPLWREPYGDRQIELVIIGAFGGSGSTNESDSESNSVTANDPIRQLFEGCLLTDSEFSGGQDAWNELEDPFSFSWE